MMLAGTLAEHLLPRDALELGEARDVDEPARLQKLLVHQDAEGHAAGHDVRFPGGGFLRLAQDGDGFRKALRSAVTAVHQQVSYSAASATGLPRASAIKR